MPDAGDMEKCDENGRLYPESESFEVSGVEPTPQMKTYLSSFKSLFQVHTSNACMLLEYHLLLIGRFLLHTFCDRDRL